ncbi:prolipoprotein diacylglyceryl transferase [Demequina pelophila]|uniref:prolipoprotein diacylglyceryl transferase n=1 Tax=Demequina pelophila TaxID=1638984 RepID=UPI0007851599|nr:prolipoprotein diacylglyceryl transferase [Demequina pelophila]
MRTSIPSPPVEWSQIHLGPLTIHVYALCILAGIFAALWLTARRWKERGGDPEKVMDVAFWAIPFGIVGGRLYHVISTPGPYFGEGGDPLAALRIWEGGLGIWGAVALGAFGAWLGARRAGVSFPTFADAVAPGVLLAQAIGRLGNYFNQELFGAPTTLPWALEIEPAFRPEGYEQFATFHPTFLYEMVWNLAGVALLLWLDRKYDLRGGRTFWLYVIVYVSGRLWIEAVRIDTAVHVLGLRINIWVSIAVLAGAIVAFIVLGRLQARIPAEERPDRSRLAAAETDDPSEATPREGADDDAATPASSPGTADGRAQTEDGTEPDEGR